ncbi:MAG: hypothetical protein DSZ28_01165 [Thiothrix sp.]|nr:MAG: hypothetical protein DSZ28_01165 [Thiothrix sp.]
MNKIPSTKELVPYLRRFVLLIMMTLLLACSSDNDNPTEVNTSRGNKEVSEALQKGSTWKTGCIPDEKGSEVAIWSFTLTDFSLKLDRYSDSACANKDNESSFNLSGTYEVGSEEITSPEGYKAWEIDFTAPDVSEPLLSLVALSDDKSKMLMAEPDTNHPSDFSDAVEFTSGEKGQGTPKDLEGSWDTSCLEAKDGNSIFLGYDFKKGQFTETIIIYSDANCKTEDKKGKFPGKTVIGKTVSTDDGFTATELDLEFDEGGAEKLLYATTKTESGRDALAVSRTTEDGSRPTSLEPAFVYLRQGDSKRSSNSEVNEAEPLGYIEIQGHILTPELTSEYEEKLQRDVGFSGYTIRDSSEELRDLLPNQEGLRSGTW